MEKTIYGIGAPHIKSRMTTDRIMKFVILALIPAGINGIFQYGAGGGLVILITCLSSVTAEYLFEKIAKKPITVKECGGILNGLLTAYCLPPSVDWYIAALAGVLCALVMQLGFHFFHRNPVSPVLFTRLILLFAFREQMTTYVMNGVAMAAPLEILKEGGSVNTLYMILGKVPGCMGDTSVLWLCFGAIFLIIMGIMDFRVSGTYLFSFAAFMAVFGGQGLSSYYLTAQLAGGGLMLVLWYVAPAYSTLPVTKRGRWLYGLLLGILTGIFRLFAPSPEDLCFAVLIANLCVPFIERITMGRPFGIERGQL